MAELFLLDGELRLNACAHLDRPLTAPMGDGEIERWTRLAGETRIRSGEATLRPKIVWHVPFGRPRVLAAQVEGPDLQAPGGLILCHRDQTPETWLVGAVAPSTECPAWLRRVVRQAGEGLQGADATLVGPFRRRRTGEGLIGFKASKAFDAGAHVTLDTPFIGLWAGGSLLKYWACPADWTERQSSPLDLSGPTGRRARKTLDYQARGARLGGE